MTQLINDAESLDFDALLNDNFNEPEQVVEQAAQATTITVDRLITAIKGVAIAAFGLDRDFTLTMFKPLAELITHVGVDDRPLLEKAMEEVFKNKDDAEWFMGLCPEPTEGGPAFEPFTMNDLLNMPPKQWLIENVVGVADLVMLYGASGSGKSHIAIDLIFAGLTGGMFARRFSVARPLRIAYAAGEGLSGLKSRFEAVSDFYMATNPFADWTGFTFFKVVPQLYLDQHTEYKATMLNFIAEWKARQDAGQAQPLDMLIIDTLHTASVGSDENSAKDSGVILSIAKKAIQELGCAVVLVHHTGKSGNSERGSSALRGAMDSMILIEKLSEQGTKAKMSCAKLKDGEQWQAQTFDLASHLDSVRVWWDEPGDDGPTKGKEDGYKEDMLKFMAENPGKKLVAKTLGEVAGISQTHAQRILKRMVDANLCNSELMDTSKESSNRNPLAYFVPKSNAKVHS